MAEQSGITEQRVVVVGPNLSDQSRGSYHVHAAGCGDLKRDRNVKDEDQSYVFTARSLDEVVGEVFADIIAENDDAVSQYFGEFYFAPCVKLGAVV